MKTTAARLPLVVIPTTNFISPALRSGHRLLQRSSPQKQFPISNMTTTFTLPYYMCVTVLLSCLVLMYAGCKNSDHAYQLDSQLPTYDLIVNGLDGFAYDKTGETSLAEAEHMLKYLSSDVNIHSFADDVKCGLFKTGYHVTIWINTYGKTNNYGVRYGTNQDHSYLVSNSTYFEIQKPKASSPAQSQ